MRVNSEYFPVYPIGHTNTVHYSSITNTLDSWCLEWEAECTLGLNTVYGNSMAKQY